ncbi:alpha/beta fold hydrolase [Veillonella magna]|uniref:alpha/beta fold hydrolase n=1 Tax=Veillonella magna TaxID=464322 RepID=UPI000428C0F4|nr:alpha/beta hydrolase [Veillonella magna]
MKTLKEFKAEQMKDKEFARAYEECHAMPLFNDAIPLTDTKYFPDFTQSFIQTDTNVFINTLYKLVPGKPPVLLLHGHPETHLIWRFMANKLTKYYSVIMTDLRGYGDSSKPQGLPDHSNYSKRIMAQDQIAVMEELGFSSFHIVAHDRGARVAHRLIADHPQAAMSCTLMDILPTYEMYEDTNKEFATAYYHWFLYIQPHGLPEKLLAADPDFFIHFNLDKKVSPAARHRFSEDVLNEYIRCFSDPKTVHGIAEDYRASASIDIQYDVEDIKNNVILHTPLLVLWGNNGIVGKLWDVVAGWKEKASNVVGYGIPDCGHFVPEEQPEFVLEKLLPFLRSYDK